MAIKHSKTHSQAISEIFCTDFSRKRFSSDLSRMEMTA